MISFAVTAKLICVFVFAYAKCWFSHAGAHFQFPVLFNTSEPFLTCDQTCLNHMQTTKVLIRISHEVYVRIPCRSNLNQPYQLRRLTRVLQFQRKSNIILSRQPTKALIRLGRCTDGTDLRLCFPSLHKSGFVVIENTFL